MGTIVCILALLLAGHGLGLIIKMRMFCLLIKRVETKYIKKIDGIVVDVDTYVKDGKLLMRPSVEFTLEGEGEKCCRSINPNIIVEDITQFSYYPKDFHIGDKVTVWYNYKRQNKLFHFHKTFCSEFDIINTKQNVHFTKVVSPIYQFCLSLHQFSIGAKAPFIIKEINTTASS